MTDEELKNLKVALSFQSINKSTFDSVHNPIRLNSTRKKLLELVEAEQNRRARRTEDVSRAIKNALEWERCFASVDETDKNEEDAVENLAMIKLAITALEQMNMWSCAYCGESVHQKEDIDYHIRNCAKHPIAEYRHRIAELEQD